jgi:hypothetical protein
MLQRIRVFWLRHAFDVLTFKKKLQNKLLYYPTQHAFAFGVVFSTVKTSLADWMVQRYVEGKEEIDWRRNAAFAAFGCVYLGGVQYGIYVKLFGRLFPNAERFALKPLASKIRDPQGIRNVGAQLFLDQCIHHPFGYFPCFYTVKTLVQGGTVAEAMESYSRNFKDDMIALWQIGVPAYLINFAFSPMWFRVPYVACISLGWTAFMSFRRGEREATPEVTPETTAEGKCIIAKTSQSG